MMKTFVLTLVLGLCAGFMVPEPPGAIDKLCRTHGRIAFVQYLSDADVQARIVTTGASVRVKLTDYPDQPGEWKVVGRNERPDIKVFIQSYSGQNVIDMKFVDQGPGC